jgi:hypothetical protein
LLLLCWPGLVVCRGRYIVRLDADDVMMPRTLLPRLQWLREHPDIDVQGGAVVIPSISTAQSSSTTAQSSSTTAQSSSGVLEACTRVLAFPRHPVLVKWDMLFYCCLAHPTIVAKREVRVVATVVNCACHLPID